MRKQLFLYSLLLLPSTIFCQIITPGELLTTKTNDIATYDVKSLRFYQTAVQSRFAEPLIVDTQLVRLIRNKSIFRVDYVFTAYKKAPEFSQDSLNKQRLEELQKSYPELFDHNIVQWNFYRQTSAATEEDAARLFHGFVFYARIPYYQDTTGKIIPINEGIMLKALMGEHFKEAPDSVPFKFEKICDTLKSISKIPSGRFIPRSRRKAAKGILYRRRNILWRRKEKIRIEDHSKVECYYATGGSIHGKVVLDPYTNFSLTADTIISDVLNQKKGLDSVMVVEDVTGSMSPYIAQTLEWRRQNTGVRGYHDFAFFNDGDSHPDGPVGRSGGVYCVHSESPKNIEKEASIARIAGYGGAGPENNIEALLKANECTPECKSFLMIADNLAPVRDLKLLKQLEILGKPVNIILCGSMYGEILYDYIDIATKTGGSIYTMDYVLDVKGMKEGQLIEIGKEKFRLKDGKLERAK